MESYEFDKAAEHTRQRRLSEKEKKIGVIN